MRITNPGTGMSLNAFGLIDTGADECALPASYVSLLGYNLQPQALRSSRSACGAPLLQLALR